MGIPAYTIGVAGHIDHGKTALTKALTEIDTDRLKEEKQRQISIEPGFAKLELDHGLSASIVDVPGHERFIRQMIAGVAGIDAVLLVIAADEGMMPQTKEHMEILHFLGIEHAIIVITKIDQVDEEMLELVSLEAEEELADTVFSQAAIVYVDSLSGKGIASLKTELEAVLEKVEQRSAAGVFRLPIDQVFTVQGQGTVVRGTVFDGIVEAGSSLLVLPQQQEVKARQIQVHHTNVPFAKAGQRAAINISGIARDELRRGNVLVSSQRFMITNTIDVVLQFVNDLNYPLKQRTPINLYAGTAEVMGKIVFFDRNELTQENEEVYCQLRLDEDIVVKRGDRVIIRRPSPAETVAGGWVIDPNGERYRFGSETIQYLQRKREGTAEERVQEALREHHWLSGAELSKLTSIEEADLSELLDESIRTGEFVEVKNGMYALEASLQHIQDTVEAELAQYHEAHPLMLGVNKAELIQRIRPYPNELVSFIMERLTGQGFLRMSGQFVALPTFLPHYPKAWAKRMEEAVQSLRKDGLHVQDWKVYTEQASLPVQEAHQLRTYLIQTKQAFSLSEKMVISVQAVREAVLLVHENAEETFNLPHVKDTLNLSRKYLIPVLELFDSLKLTVRIGNERKWIGDPVNHSIFKEHE